MKGVKSKNAITGATFRIGQAVAIWLAQEECKTINYRQNLEGVEDTEDVAREQACDGIDDNCGVKFLQF